MSQKYKANTCFPPAWGNTQKHTLKYIKQYNGKQAFTGGFRLKKEVHFFPPVCKGILQDKLLGITYALSISIKRYRNGFTYS